MTKKQIPYILRVLCRWIPGLKLDESGPSPKPTKKGLEVGDEMYTIYANTSDFPDMSLIDWTTDVIHLQEGGSITEGDILVKPLINIKVADEGYLAFAAIKIPEGTAIGDEPTTQDLHLIFVTELPYEDPFDDRNKEYWMSGDGMVYADIYYYEYMGASQEIIDEAIANHGWRKEYIEGELKSTLLAEFGESKERCDLVYVGAKTFTHKTIDRVPFEREDITPEYIYENKNRMFLFFNDKVDPEADVKQLEYTTTPEMEGLGVAILLGRSDVHPFEMLNVGLHVEFMASGDHQMGPEGTIHLDDDGYLIMGTSGAAIWMNQAMADAYNSVDPSVHFTKGWKPMGDEGFFLGEFNCVWWEDADQLEKSQILVAQQDKWNKWISKDPFYYPVPIIPAPEPPVPPTPGTLTEFTEGQTINVGDKILFDLARDSEMRNFLEHEVEYDSCGYGTWLLTDTNGNKLLMALDLSILTHGQFSAKILCIDDNNDSIIYATEGVHSGNMDFDAGFSTQNLTNGAIEFDISSAVTLGSIGLSSKWNGILAGYQAGQPTPFEPTESFVKGQTPEHIYLNTNMDIADALESMGPRSYYDSPDYEYMDCAGTKAIELLAIGYEEDGSGTTIQRTQLSVKAVRFDPDNNSGSSEPTPEMLADDYYQLRYVYDIGGTARKDRYIPGRGNLLYDSSYEGWVVNSNLLNNILTEILEYNNNNGYTTFVQSLDKQEIWKDFINQDSRIID